MTIETMTTSASAENSLAARQWVEAFNARDDKGEADALTADYIGHAPDSMRLPELDGDAWAALMGTFLEGFPDLRLDVQDSVSDEEMNAQRILFTGTHTGYFRGLPPTGRKVRFAGLEMSRMVGGKVAEHWFQIDALTMFEQLGLRVVPGPRLLPRLMTAPLKRLSKKSRR
jgi:predicted ester cyclase